MKITNGLVFILLLLISLNARTEVLEEIIAVVNNEIITLSDLKDMQRKLRGGSVIMDDLLVQQDKIPALLQDRKKLVDLMIDEKILDSEVKKRDLEVTIERVEQEIRKISKRNSICRTCTSTSSTCITIFY